MNGSVAAFALAILLLGMIPQAWGASTTCVPSPGNPVVASGQDGSWDSNGVGYQTVSFNGSAFNMLYTGFGPNSTATGWSAIGLASSLNGEQWSKIAPPVFGPGPSGSWDSISVERPSVVWNGTMYLMYYTGFPVSGSASIGLAFSKDLHHWDRYVNNPVLARGPSAFDNVSVRFPSVVYSNGTYEMWYVGRAENHTLSIGYATSSDGLRWTKSIKNPVLSNQNLPRMNSFGPRDQTVVELPSGYLMVFFYGGNITYAFSTDGISWNSNADPIIRSTGNTTTDFPSALGVNGSVLIWFTAFVVPSPSVIELGTCAILVITSTTKTTTISTVFEISNVTSIATSYTTVTEVHEVESPLLIGTSTLLAVLLVISVAANLWYRAAKKTR